MSSSDEKGESSVPFTVTSVQQGTTGGQFCRQWRGQVTRVALQLSAAFLLYWVSYGTDLSDGIIFARLILPPCAPKGKGEEAANGSGIINSSASIASAGLDDAMEDAMEDGVLLRGNTTNTPVHTNLSWNTTPIGLNVSNRAINQSSSSPARFECGGFGGTAAETAWITSMATAFRVASGVTGGVLIDAFGIRKTIIGATVVFSLSLAVCSFATQLYQVYLTRGFLSGVAAGVLFSVPVHCLSITYDSKMVIAAGLAFLGSGVCAVTYGYVGKEVVIHGDWRWYYRMIALLSLLCVPAAFVIYFEPESYRKGHQAQNDHKDMSPIAVPGSLLKLRLGLRKLLDSIRKGFVLYRNVDFLLIAACYVLYAIGYFFPFISSSHRSKALGISAGDAYLQVAYVGFGTVAGCLSCAASGLLFNVRATLYQALGLTICGLSMILSILVTTETSLIAYNVFYAAASGFTTAACGPVAREVMPAEMTVHAFGHLYLVSSPAMAIGPPVSGWLYDVTQDYTIPLIFGGLVLIVAGLLILLVDIRIWRRRRQLTIFKTSLWSSSTDADEPPHAIVCVHESSV
eukprot:scpid69751/ scgid35662/ Monocarboxylate transporter 3; Retinal epithelial membrane protein; Solute carrier family 16 member 8